LGENPAFKNCCCFGWKRGGRQLFLFWYTSYKNVPLQRFLYPSSMCDECCTMSGIRISHLDYNFKSLNNSQIAVWWNLCIWPSIISICSLGRLWARGQIYCQLYIAKSLLSYRFTRFLSPICLFINKLCNQIPWV
jgi:hypothetical protein